MTDPDPMLPAVLADALAGRRLSPREAHELAAGLRALAGSTGPATGPDAALRHHLAAAAALLDAQADHPRRR